MECLGDVSAELRSKYINFAETHHIDISTMGDEWEAYSLANKGLAPSSDAFDRFKNHLLSSKVSKNNAKGGAAGAATAAKKRVGSDENELSSPNVLKQAKGDIESKFAARVSASPAVAWGDRTGAGQVIAHFNTNLPAPAPAKSLDKKIVLDYASFPTNVKQRYRFMYTTLEERARALDEHLLSVTSEMVDKYSMDDLSPIGVPRTDTVKVVGRVCNEAHEGRMNKTVLMLEGGRHEAGGQRIHLGVDDVASYSLFPGQVVGVEGLCPSGRKIIAASVCEGVAKPFAETKVDDLLRFHHSSTCQDGAPVSIFCAAGPFTTSSNLDFEPLTDLLAVVKKIQPDVVILVGPFLEAGHNSILNGQVMLVDKENPKDKVYVNFERFFAEKVSGLLEDWFESNRDIATQFVIVPSLDDTFHDNVFPQPPFADRFKGGKPDPMANHQDLYGTLGIHYVNEGRANRVHCVSNPCTLKINEVVVGITSVDPLSSLNTQECSLNISRMNRLAQHLIMQQSYYPLFPPTDNVNVDLRHLDKIRMSVTPDILLIPSKLASFVKDVQNCLVINPGSLTKMGTGGSFANITVHPMPRETLEATADKGMQTGHKILERARVEVQKI